MKLPIVQTLSPNCDDRPAGQCVDMLVLHYTGMQRGALALQRLCDPAAQVSAHYVIEENGTIHTLVPEKKRAWHAGVSFWRGETAINARSIGIELVNPGHDFGYRPFPAAQMAALLALLPDILARHPIPARNIVGHSDIAPRRKEDPGEFFDWPLLARHGIGLWPFDGQQDDHRPPALSQTEELLSSIGYDTKTPFDALIAFQRRFRPWKIDGWADPQTLNRLRAVALACSERPS